MDTNHKSTETSVMGKLEPAVLYSEDMNTLFTNTELINLKRPCFIADLKKLNLG